MRILQREAKENRSVDGHENAPRKVRVVGAIGMAGYRTLPGTHTLDEDSLADPLLARLPALETRWWRAGHRPRAVPAGYPEKLIDPGHRMEDPRLDQYVEKLQLVTRGDLWSVARWSAILGFLRGRYRGWIDTERYRQGIVELNVPMEGISGTWFEPGRWRPLRVALPRIVQADSLRIRASCGGELSLEFTRRGQRAGEAVLEPDTTRGLGDFEWYEMTIPDSLRDTGFDAVILRGHIFHGNLVLRSLSLDSGSLPIVPTAAVHLLEAPLAPHPEQLASVARGIRVGRRQRGREVDVALP